MEGRYICFFVCLALPEGEEGCWLYDVGGGIVMRRCRERCKSEKGREGRYR